MKKIAQKDLPSNMKPSRQNIDQIGRTSQGAPKNLTQREQRFIDRAKRKKAPKKKIDLKYAMNRLSANQ